jgi:hypothetical protein
MYTVRRGEQSLGPMSLEELRTKLRAGEIAATDGVTSERFSTPTTVGKLLELMLGDGTGGVVPFKNKPALVAYYLAVASLIPVVGLFTGVAAFVLGLKGRRKAKEEPWVKGTAHAWIGIGCGGVLALTWLAVGVLVAIAAMH